MGFDFDIDEMHCHCPFQNCIALFYTTPKFFLLLFKFGQVVMLAYAISEPSFKTLPPPCSDPSAIKKVTWDSILAWMKCSATALFKTVLHFFIRPPKFFLLHFKVGQVEMLYNF